MYVSYHSFCTAKICHSCPKSCEMPKIKSYLRGTWIGLCCQKTPGKQNCPASRVFLYPIRPFAVQTVSFFFSTPSASAISGCRCVNGGGFRFLRVLPLSQSPAIAAYVPHRAAASRNHFQNCVPQPVNSLLRLFSAPGARVEIKLQLWFRSGRTHRKPVPVLHAEL